MHSELTKENSEAYWWFGSLAIVLLSAEQTMGRSSVVEITEPAGAVAPLHVHTKEDEAFVVLDGDVVVEVGGERVALSPGEVGFGPRGVPHCYEVGPNGCRMLFVLTPGGFEGLIRLMSTPAERLMLPGADVTYPDLEELGDAIGEFGCSILEDSVETGETVV
ncbi:MAG: cupin domain-containing protein [Solirubrobacterales bacterium]